MCGEEKEWGKPAVEVDGGGKGLFMWCDTEGYHWVNCDFSFRNGSAIGLPVPPTTALITPGPVRHCQIPDLPVDGSLFFEFLFFIYLLIVLFIQYINIYKTVWWYPYNHPASCTSLVSLEMPLSSLSAGKKAAAGSHIAQAGPELCV